jgi:hypothetical protein
MRSLFEAFRDMSRFDILNIDVSTQYVDTYRQEDYGWSDVRTIINCGSSRKYGAVMGVCVCSRLPPLLGKEFVSFG